MSNGRELPYDPMPGESLFSFLLRRSYGLGLSGVRSLVRAAGTDYQYGRCGDLVRLYDFAEPLGRFLGIHPEHLRAMGYGPGPKGDRKVELIGFGGRVLQRNAVDVGRHRVCPACVDEAWIAKAAWELPILTVCPRHRLILNDRCDNCGRFIEAARLAPHVCRCGRPLRKLPHLPADDGATDLAARMYACLGLNRDGIPDHSVRDDLEFSDLCQLAWAIRLLKQPQGLGRLPHLFSRRSPEEFHLLLKDSACVLANWPCHLYELFEDAPRRCYKVINDLPAGTAKDIFKNCWKAGPASGRSKLSRGWCLINQRRKEGFTLLTGIEVKTVLGISDRQLANLKIGGEIVPRACSERRNAMWDASEIAALYSQGRSAIRRCCRRPRMERSVLTERMAGLLGMNFRAALRLMRAPGDLSRPTSVDDACNDLREIELKLDETLLSVPFENKGDLVSAVEIVKTHRRHLSLTQRQAIELFVIGRLIPRSRLGLSETLADLLFERKYLQSDVMRQLLETQAFGCPIEPRPVKRIRRLSTRSDGTESAGKSAPVPSAGR